MLPCSVRRVAATGAHQSPLLSTLPRATVTRSYRPSTRRRYSSSKPSRDNGSEDPPVRQSVQPAAEAKAGKAKASGEKKQRRTKDTSDKLKFPSVPTTAHIPSDFLALSSFFSLHRPISVTRGLPRNVTEGAFASIFVAPSRSAKAAEVISTLSRTVDDLDNDNHTTQGQQRPLSLQQQEAIAEAEAHNEQIDQLEQQQQRLDVLNAGGADISVQVNNMAGQFLPFRPPPLPQAESSAFQAEAAARIADAAEEGSSVAELEEEVQKRVYKAVFTIEETTDSHGEVKIVAHSPELIEDMEASSPSSRLGRGKKAARMTISVEGGGGRVESSSSTSSLSAREQEQEQEQQPRSFLHRMRLRQLNFQRQETRLRRPRWYLISVKRQRKLKMKKKKYKKLTRRLRHDKLKQGRT